MPDIFEIEPIIWDTDHLMFAVREPFPSKTSQTTLVTGQIPWGKVLSLRSLMPENGVIFSDDLEMKAIANQYAVPDAAVRALAAGCDGVLICGGNHDLQAAALAAGELDFGLLLPPVAGASFEHLVVQRERFVAALPARHALAQRPGRVALRELSEEAFVMVPRDIAPGLYDIVAGLAARAGFSPRVAQEAIQMQTVVSLVSSGLGVAVVPGSIANLGRRGVIYRELADPHPRLELWLAWRRGSLGAPGRELVEVARKALRKAAA